MKKTYIENSKIIIILNKENINVETQFRTFDILNTVIKKIHTIFYPLPKSIILKYGNINITNCTDVKLGNLFPNKKVIKISIINNSKQLKEGSKPIIKKINQSVSSLSVRSYADNKSKKYIYKYSKLKLPPINKNMIHNISLNDIKSKNVNNKNIKNEKNISLYKIKIKSKNQNEIKNKLNNENKITINMLNQRIKNINNSCGECFYREIKFYCRYCNKFLCEKCKDKNHSNKNHIIIEVANNIDITFSKYNKEINDIFTKSLKSFDNLDKHKEITVNIDDWNQKFIKDIDKMVEIAYELKNNTKNIEIEGNNKNLNENEKSLIDEEYTNINKIDCSPNRDPFSSFFEINNKEKEIYKIINEYKSDFDKKNSIPDKISGMFLEVEKEIDKIMFQFEEQIYKSKNKNIN